MSVAALSALPLPAPEVLVGLGLGLLCAILLLVLVLQGQARRAEAKQGRAADEALLASLRRIEEQLPGGAGSFELRRIEHALYDLRDGLKRLEDTLLHSAPRAQPGSDLLLPAGVAERVVRRLEGLGYERVRIVTPAAELEPLARGDGAAVVEARRGGVVCKGRARFQGGAIVDVQMQPTYGAFP